MPAHNQCKDPDCHGCRAASEGLELAALWRKLNGNDTFMGIVRLPTALFLPGKGPPIDLLKLDDPSGELEGPGHRMTNEEFLTECVHYDESRADIPFMFLPLLDRRHFFPLDENDIGAFMRNRAVGLLSFRDKPEDFADSQDSEFDLKYPHGSPPQVRAGDAVKVVAAGSTFSQGSSNPFRERFWIDVTSVTSFGIITGSTGNELHCCDINPETGYLAFHISAVLGVNHGEHWENHGDNEEENHGDE